MLVDGLGDGLMMEGPFDLSFLRTTSFATLQVRLYTHTYTYIYAHLLGIY